MKNLLVMYYASGRINVKRMSAAEAIMLNAYWDVDRITIINVGNRSL